MVLKLVIVQYHAASLLLTGQKFLISTPWHLILFFFQYFLLTRVFISSRTPLCPEPLFLYIPEPIVTTYNTRPSISFSSINIISKFFDFLVFF